MRNKLNQIAPIEDEDDVDEGSDEGSSKNIATLSAEGGDVSSGLRHRVGNSNADEQGFGDIGGGEDVSETVLRLTAEISRLEEGFNNERSEFSNESSEFSKTLDEIKKERDELKEENDHLKSA